MALVARVDAGRLVLPWEQTNERAAFESEAFSANLADAEREEFAAR